MTDAGPRDALPTSNGVTRKMRQDALDAITAAVVLLLILLFGFEWREPR